jgi:group I intron endonuclease
MRAAFLFTIQLVIIMARTQKTVIYVYLILCKINNKRYVGITAKTVQKRFKRHLRDAANGCQNALHRAIRAHGVENFECQSLEICSSWEEACQREIVLIRELQTRVEQHGYNMTDGGEGGWGLQWSLEARARQSAIHKGLHTRDKLSSETLKKMSDARKGKPMNDEQKRKLSIWNTGRKHTEEAKQKMADSHRGSKRTEATKQRMHESSPHKKRVVQFATDGTTLSVYPSMKIAARITGVAHANISACCHGRRPRAGGFGWCFENINTLTEQVIELVNSRCVEAAGGA